MSLWAVSTWWGQTGIIFLADRSLISLRRTLSRQTFPPPLCSPSLTLFGFTELLLGSVWTSPFHNELPSQQQHKHLTVLFCFISGWRKNPFIWTRHNLFFSLKAWILLSWKKRSWQKEVIIITFYSQSSYIYNWDDVVMPDYKMWHYKCLWNRPWNMHHFIPGRAVYVQSHRGQIDRMLAAAGREKEKEREWVLGLAPVPFSSAECTSSMGDWESTGHLHATGLFAIPPLPFPSFFSFLGPLEHLPLPPICRLLCTLFPFTIQLKPAAPFQPQLSPQQCRYTCSRTGLLYIHTSRQHTDSSGGLCSEKKKHPPCVWGSDALLCF